MLKQRITTALAIALFSVSLACGAKPAATNENKPADNKAAAPKNEAPKNEAPKNTATATNTKPPAEKAAETATGTVYTHEEGGLQFEVPKGWSAEAKGDDMEIMTPDKEVYIYVMVSNADSVEATMTGLGEQIDKYLSDVNVDGEPKQDQHNGMELVSVSGTGSYEGQNVAWDVSCLISKKPIIVLSIFTKGGIEANASDLQKFINSIKKA